MRRSIIIFSLVCACHPQPEEQLLPVATPVTLSPTTEESQKSSSAEPTKESVKIEEAFVQTLLSIGKNYESYGRTDDFYHWAPEMCDLPRTMRPGTYLSESADDETHGKKLYSLFAGFYDKPSAQTKNTDPYPRSGFLPTSEGQKAYLDIAKGEPLPDGLAIVKESWIPEEITDQTRISALQRQRSVDEHGWLGDKSLHHEFWPYAQKGEKFFQASKKAGLFVMYKTKENTPNTDNGWVYATLSADGKEVTSAGTLSKCMGCHKHASYGRLFIDKKGKK